MTTLHQAADEFLAQERIAVAGVSRDPKQPANLIYRRLRIAGHQVFPVNPAAAKVEGDRCFSAVNEIPGGVDAVVIVTPAAAAAAIVADSAAAGATRVWLHRGMGPGSVPSEAVDACRRHGIAVIPGACPNMFGPTADPAHRCMRHLQRLTGKLPLPIDGLARQPARAG